jgi:hypothetical protein
MSGMLPVAAPEHGTVLICGDQIRAQGGVSVPQGGRGV